VTELSFPFTVSLADQYARGCTILDNCTEMISKNLQTDRASRIETKVPSRLGTEVPSRIPRFPLLVRKRADTAMRAVVP